MKIAKVIDIKKRITYYERALVMLRCYALFSLCFKKFYHWRA